MGTLSSSLAEFNALSSSEEPTEPMKILQNNNMKMFLDLMVTNATNKNIDKIAKSVQCSMSTKVERKSVLCRAQL